MHNYSKHFIEKTARDYDLDIWLVESIANKYPEKGFYEALEAELLSQSQ